MDQFYRLLKNNFIISTELVCKKVNVLYNPSVYMCVCVCVGFNDVQ